MSGAPWLSLPLSLSLYPSALFCAILLLLRRCAAARCLFYLPFEERILSLSAAAPLLDVHLHNIE
jgi:hypothetical protein